AALADRAMEERELVTVLFADITGSTTLGERFDPERWRVLLQRFFSVMTSTIEAWGGTVQKVRGDSVMATFGVPIVREDDAERALRAACQMLERLMELNTEFKSQHGVSLAIRVGVNTGEVMAASDQNIVTGDAVNVAARLEQMADPGTILAGERTYAAARGAFVFGEPEAREGRGKAAPVTVRPTGRWANCFGANARSRSMSPRWRRASGCGKRSRWCCSGFQRTRRPSITRFFPWPSLPGSPSLKTRWTPFGLWPWTTSSR